MMKRSVLALGIVWVTSTCAQVSPFTGKPVLPPDSSGSYRLLIGGHFHGASSSVSGYPAATVLASIGAMNATKANVFLSTGDLFMDPDRDSARYATAFFAPLQLPLFNAPGNHDLEGKAYGIGARMPVVIAMGKDRIILLDTERDDSSIKGDQLEVLSDLAARAEAEHVAHVFIVTHRPIWSEGDVRYAPLFEGNTRSLTGSNFKSDVLPVLRELARTASIHWISGSMAGRAPASIFFQPQEKNITFIQSAVRDRIQDALLIADVDPTGIRWSALSLSGSTMEPVETYDAAWWEARGTVKEEFHWRRMPYLIKKTVSYPVFWYGFGVAGLCVVLFRLLLRGRRRANDPSKS